MNVAIGEQAPATATATGTGSAVAEAAAAGEGRFVCVVVHDVATSTRAPCLRTLRAVAAVAALPVTLLAVPRYHGESPSADFEAWLGQRSASGDELALHGFTHRDELPPRGLVDRLRRRSYTRSEGEFWALPEAEAMQRIDDGIGWFRRNRWPLQGFVAPAWLLGAGARAALQRQRFEWTATVRELVHLSGGAAIGAAVVSQSVVYSTSAAWRRQLSLAWNAGVALAERRNRVLRIELHPRDADFPAIRRSWQKILERALADREAVTVVDLMRRLRSEQAAGAPTTTLWQSTSAE